LGSSGRANQRRNGECTSMSCRRDSARSSVSLLRVRHTGTSLHHAKGGASHTYIANTTPLNITASSVNTKSTTTAQTPS
jgi:hypothetical protein